MRRFTLTILAIAASIAVTAQTVADFESFTLTKADTYYVNYVGSGDVGFDNGLAHFPCYYNSAWSIWSSGFAYSNMTDSVTSGYTNQYSAKTAKGYNGSSKYIAVNGTGGQNYIKLTGIAKGGFANGFYVTNSTYAYNSMRDGDAFAKKFGGTSGNDADWFKIVIYGYNNGVKKADSVQVYLADFRNSDNTKDYILKTWKWVNLMPLGKVDSITFDLSSSDVGTWGMNTPGYYCIDNFTTQENLLPYAPQALVSGSAAVFKTDASIKGWATNCTVTRGWMDIDTASKGKVTFGTDIDGVGAADNSLVSLGDSGTAVLGFNNVVYNGAGADFVVFENGFANGANAEEAFLELAFVEVSSDGINYTRFPASCISDTTQMPIAGQYTNARRINNLAGKYIGGYGTPFDLQELAGTPGLDIDNITHIRIVDVVGSTGAHAQRDKDGVKINDPYPTTIPSGGFDLDAVGAMYLKWPAAIPNVSATYNLSVYPNPATDIIQVSFKQQPFGELYATVTDLMGNVVIYTPLNTNNTITLSNVAKGNYYLLVTDTKGNKWVEKISKI